MNYDLGTRTKQFPLHLTVFLSSPGDVDEERRIAQRILDELPQQPLLKGKVFIETIAWDDPYAPTPLTANETPQHSVNRFKRRPSECDLTVVILWSRLGTTLPANARKCDGSTYASGTEWEFEDAQNAKKDILIYHRTEMPRTSIEDTDLESRRKAYKVVQDFLAKFRNPDGSAAGGYNEYESPDAFANIFEKHLEVYIRKLLDIGQASEIDQYLCDFTDELRLAEGLVGRTELFSTIQKFEASHPSGYFRLTAPAGLGKTTIAAGVTQRYGAISFFTSASRGFTRPDQCLNHLSAELITRFHLPYDTLPVRAGEDSSFFEKVLQEAAEKASNHLWLVIDALDEADAVVSRNALLLPKKLPEGVFCFLTQRPGDYPLETDPLTSIKDYVLTWDSPTQQADIVAFLTREVSQPAVLRALQKAIPYRDQPFFVSELGRLSDGNFMYLSYLLRDIATGEWSFNASDGEALLPSGLAGYYTAIWSRMERMTVADGGREWRSLFRPVIGFLAVAREPVTISWLADLSGCDPEDIQNPVLSTWRRFLSQERRNRAEQWRILHRSFGDFLIGKLDLEARHRIVGQYYLEPTNWSRHEGYASRHLSSHLRATDDIGGLSHLIADPGWYENQMAADPTGGRYELDIRETRSVAAILDSQAAEGRRATPALAQEIGAALLLSTLAGFWTSIPPDTIETLLQLGILSDVQALTFIEKMQEPDVQSRAIVAVLPLLSDALLPRVIEVARTMGAEHQTRILLALAERASDAEREVLLNETLAVVRAMEDDARSKPGLLSKVAVNFSGEIREACLTEAQDLATRIEDPSDRAHSLSELIADIPDLLKPLEQALFDLRTDSESDLNSGEDLIEIVRQVPDEQRPRVARLAVVIALEIPDPAEKALALTALASELSGADRRRVSRAALEAARSIDDPEDKANNLLELSDEVGETERAELLEEVEQWICKTVSPESQIRVLMRLSAHLPEQQGKSRLDQVLGLLNDIADPSSRISLLTSGAEHLTGVLKDVALEAARNIVPDLNYRFARARALMDIGRVWSGHRMRQLVNEAARIPGGILAIGQPEKDDLERVDLLAALIPELNSPERDNILSEAKAIPGVIERPYDYIRAVASLLPSLGPQDKSQAIDEIRTRVRGLEPPEQRAELLMMLIPNLTGDERIEAIRVALAAARSIVPGALSATGTINMLTGIVRVDNAPRIMGRPALAILGLALHCEDDERRNLIAEALESLRDLPANFQAEMLSELAPHLSEAQIQPLLADYQCLLRDPLRDELMDSISESLQLSLTINEPRMHSQTAEPSEDEAIDEPKEDAGVEADQGVAFQVAAFSFSDVFRLNREPGQAAFTITYHPPPVWETNEKKEDLERRIVRAFAGDVFATASPEVLMSVYEDAQRLRGNSWQQPIASLLQKLATAGSPQTALADARAIWPDRLPPVVAATIASYVPAAESRLLVNTALAAVRDLDEAADRATVLAWLLPNLMQSEFATAVNDLTTAVEQMSGQDTIKLLKSIANQLDVFPASCLLKLVQQVLRSTQVRRELFVSLRDMLPALKLLAGAGVIASIAKVVTQANSWELGNSSTARG